MAVYTQLFARGTGGTGVTAMWTVPSDGFTYIVRDIRVGSLAAGTSLIVVQFSSGEQLFSCAPTGANETFGTELRQVGVAGEVLDLSTLGGGASYRITGYKLSP